MSERTIPIEGQWKRSIHDLVHEIEIIHERENSAAETCNRYRQQVEGLKATLRQQYELYQVALKEQAELERRFNDLQAAWNAQTLKAIAKAILPLDDKIRSHARNHNALVAAIQRRRVTRKELIAAAFPFPSP